MTGFARFFPWCVFGLGALYLAMAAAPEHSNSAAFRLEEFGRIPVVDGGRVKPIDTFARTNMLLISNRQDFKDDKEKTQPATRWLLDVITSKLNGPNNPEKYEIFRIENDQVLNLLGLKEKPLWYRYSINEIGPKIEVLEKEAKRAHDLDPKKRDLFDTKILELANHMQMYIDVAQLRVPLSVPPATAEGEWEPFLKAMIDARNSGQDNANARALGAIFVAYAENKPDDFNKEVAAYHKLLEKQLPDDTGKAGFEVFFNHFAPFYQCSVLYVFVFLLALGSWVGFERPLTRAAFWLGVLTVAVHTWALVARMYIQGRPPVTNLYSSAVFIGWGCVVLGLILEAIYKNGIGSAVAAVMGSLTLLVAHHLATGGDTMEMMQAVLDTNFWLATHVTIITFGYVATFVAGFIGIAYIGIGVLSRALNKELAKSLTQMMYGVLCFATLLSFTGTVLGGIWADQSWGRFWGWDPKENGALLIVIWNAAILHARWGGMIKARGMATMAVAGNIVTGWSYFGTNQLGIGLHAYGFNNALAAGLVTFWSVMAIFIGMGLLPLTMWRSFADQGSQGKGPSRLPSDRRKAPLAVGG